MSEYKPVPVEAARYVADQCEKDVVVIGSIDHAHGKLHVTTFGRTPRDKVLAAEVGDVVGEVLGDMSRVEHFEDFRLQAATVKKQRDDLYKALKEMLPEGWGDGTMDHMPGVLLARTAIAEMEGET